MTFPHFGRNSRRPGLLETSVVCNDRRRYKKILQRQRIKNENLLIGFQLYIYSYMYLSSRKKNSYRTAKYENI